MMNDVAPELCRWKRSAWGVCKIIEGDVKKTTNVGIRVHLHDTVVSPALIYASETWTLRNVDEHVVSDNHRALERRLSGILLYTHVQKGIRRSEKFHRKKMKYAVDYAKESKMRWAEHIMRYSDDRWTRADTECIPRGIKRTLGRMPTRWSDFFTIPLHGDTVVNEYPTERFFINSIDQSAW
uniref:Reverse transcriptase n=1 Tax=Haemonchus contortus TaxID=6289 RepID=A0A7I5EE03_HAECO